MEFTSQSGSKRGSPCTLPASETFSMLPSTRPVSTCGRWSTAFPTLRHPTMPSVSTARPTPWWATCARYPDHRTMNSRRWSKPCRPVPLHPPRCSPGQFNDTGRSRANRRSRCGKPSWNSAPRGFASSPSTRLEPRPWRVHSRSVRLDHFALPEGAEADQLVQGLSRLIEQRGAETFLAAPLLLAEPRYFPEPIAPRAEGVATLL